MFFIVGYMYFPHVLMAPRKIDSSIGLPSLNKVATYLLTKQGYNRLVSHVLRCGGLARLENSFVVFGILHRYAYKKVSMVHWLY